MSEPINVLHVTTGMGTGGAERMLATLIARSQPGVQHHLLALSNPGRMWEEAAVTSVTATNLQLERKFAAIGRLAGLPRFVAAARPDVIHGWMYHGNWAAAWVRAMFARRVPLIFGIRQSLYDITRERRLTRFVIRHGAAQSCGASAVLYNSETSRRQHSAIGYRADVSAVIPNGFDTGKFRPDDAARRRARERLGIASEEFVVAMVGRFHAVKDHATFLAAAALVDSVRKRIRFVVAGPDCSPANPALRALVEARAGAARVDLVGPWTDMEMLYPAFDVLCLTSRSEGFPNVLGEAMSCGVQCIATEVGDIPYLVGANGRLVQPGDSGAIAAQIDELAGKTRTELIAAGMQARQRICDHFDISSIVQQYTRLYLTLAAEGRPASRSSRCEK